MTMPMRPIVTATTLVAYSVATVGVTSGSTALSIQSRNGSQTPGITTRPPIAARTVSTPTGISIESGRDDPVLRPEARERRDAGERERSDEECSMGERHRLAQPAHPADVLLAAEVVDDHA